MLSFTNNINFKNQAYILVILKIRPPDITSFQIGKDNANSKS